MNVKSILIVGGGTSGWMTAALLGKKLPNTQITLLESPNIPTIGVGESTIPAINDYLYSLGITDEDWMAFCNATYKTSIDFTNFDGKNTRVKYPFGLPTYLSEEHSSLDWFIKKALLGGDKEEFIDFSMGSAEMMNQNKLIKEDDNIPNWNLDRDTAYHMDAIKFAEYLRTVYCKQLLNVTHILDTVISIDCEYPNIKNLVTKEGRSLSHDLYIDCTGFKSLLLKETLKEPFVSYSSFLPNDRAVALQLPYLDKEVELESSTNATALSSGWVWNIPLINRIGTGYVFSSKFISEEAAEKELREYLINDRNLPHSREEVESLKPHHVSMHPGIHERSWVGNVCAIGLSSGFIEPLESTALMLTHNAISALLASLESRDDSLVTEFDRAIFNKEVRDSMANFAGFVAGHYAFSENKSSPFWNYVTQEIDYLKIMPSKEREWLEEYIPYLINSREWDKGLHNFTASAIMAAFGFAPITKTEIMGYNNYDQLMANAKILEKKIAEHKLSQRKYISQLDSHYTYLKNTIYKNKAGII